MYHIIFHTNSGPIESNGISVSDAIYFVLLQMQQNGELNDENVNQFHDNLTKWLIGIEFREQGQPYLHYEEDTKYFFKPGYYHDKKDPNLFTSIDTLKREFREAMQCLRWKLEWTCQRMNYKGTKY